MYLSLTEEVNLSMYGDSKAIASDKECKKFECHETTVSRSRQATRANTVITSNS